jgi:heme exporter protein A
MRLCAVDLACHRGGRDVFTGLSFAVSSGEALAITGRNGAGKSSLLRAIIGLSRIARGGLTLEQGDPELTIAEQAHYLAHQDALKPALSVGENLCFWVDFLGARGAHIRPALGAVGLDELADLPAAYLSAGQRRRLSIARLLAVKRPIWLLDEPTSTLDSAAQDHLAGFMRAHLTDGGIILAATHGSLGLGATAELRLDGSSPSPLVEGQGRGSEGGAIASMTAMNLATPTPNPSPQGGAGQTTP